MNIALLHYTAHPVVGGVEHVMRAHSRMMVDAGHHVRIIAGRGDQVDPDVEFIRFPLADSRDPQVLAAKRHLDAGQVPDSFEHMTLGIAERLGPVLSRADWVFIHNVCSLNKNLPLTAALHQIASAQGAVRFCCWYHDLAWATERYASELHAGNPWDLLRTPLPGADHVTISNFRRSELSTVFGIPEELIRVIPNGVDACTFLKLGSETGSILSQFSLLEAVPLILMPVRVTPRKNIELGLRILGRLRTNFPRACLLVTGPVGPHNPHNVEYLEMLMRLQGELGVGANTVFLTPTLGAPVSDEVLSDLYRASDLVLLPSLEEGFGIPILEAGLAGVPVFCSEIAPFKELGSLDVRYFSPDANPVDVAKRMEAVLNESQQFRLRKRVLARYGWQRIYDHFLVPLMEGR